MPELGDVEGFRRLMASRAGQRIDWVEVLDPALVCNVTVTNVRSALVGRSWSDVSRAGKWLIVQTSGPTLVIHFGMTGSLAGVDVGGQRASDDRAVFTSGSLELRFRDRRRLGRIYMAASGAEVASIVGPIGPDALGIADDVLRARLEPSRTSIKSALLDQTRIAGLGNLLSDEILWRAKVDPLTPTRSMLDAQWDALHRASQQVVRAAARAGHTPRGPTWLAGARWRLPERCPRCGAPLLRRVFGGRTSVSCPACQPDLASSATARGR